jgi:LacI family gluconate utilization system Gnt-I transcriptional repressor
MIKQRRPTLQDVADRVGVTKMSVSRFLKNPQQVSSTLRDKIAKALDDLGYIPNKAPDMLSSAKSHAIGVLVPSLTNQVFAELIGGVEAVMEQAGYQTMLAHYSYSQQSEEAQVTTLLSYNVDGLILSESVHTDRVRRMIKTAGVPVVELMDSISPAIEQAVGIDNEKAAFEMTELMISRGHRKIVYFAARMDTRTKLRFHGYEKAMKNNGLIPRSLQTQESSSFTRGALLMKQALQQYPDLDGVFSTNDDLAVGALFECQRLAIDVPTQIGIAGFHGHDITDALMPKLATVVTPREDMGNIAAQQILSRLAGEDIVEPVINLPYKLKSGESIRPKT